MRKKQSEHSAEHKVVFRVNECVNDDIEVKYPFKIQNDCLQTSYSPSGT